MVETMIRAASLCLAWTLAAAGARAGETRCWFENGAVVVPAAFGAIAGDFIVDLSRADSQLHQTPAQARGYTGGDALGTLRIAGETRAAFAVTVADLDTRSAGFTTNITGALGADAFEPFILDIQTSPCRMRLSRRAPARRIGSVRLKVTRIGGVPAIRAAISDGVTSRRGLFAIDTASKESRIAEATLSRPPPAGVDPRVRLRALSVGGRLFEQTPAGLADGAPPELAGSIGEAVWSRYRLRLDQRRGRLELTPAR
jgi:hypothetical protein